MASDFTVTWGKIRIQLEKKELFNIHKMSWRHLPQEQKTRVRIPPGYKVF
jgi:hypothetical protein